MKIFKWFLFICLLGFVEINISSASEPKIPPKIKIVLKNSEYNKYVRRSMRAYTDGEFMEKKIKKNIKNGLKLKSF